MLMSLLMLWLSIVTKWKQFVLTYVNCVPHCVMKEINSALLIIFQSTLYSTPYSVNF
jgi:hypothetical protein